MRNIEDINFVSVDFETLTPELTSACAIGLVKVVKGIIVQKFFSLIKPIPDGRKERNSFVHGITDDMLVDAPTYKELFPQIENFFESHNIACHNAGTDINIIDRLHNYYELRIDDVSIIDTMKITGTSLTKACEIAKIDIECHHDALSDATACAELILNINGININHPNYEKQTRYSEYDKQKMTSETHKKLDDDKISDKSTPFYNKKVVITGIFEKFPIREELGEMLRRYGADMNSSISSKTNIVIIGNGAGPSKVQKIDILKKQGVEIEIINEEKLLKIIKEYYIK